MLMFVTNYREWDKNGRKNAIVTGFVGDESTLTRDLKEGDSFRQSSDFFVPPGQQVPAMGLYELALDGVDFNGKIKIKALFPFDRLPEQGKSNTAQAKTPVVGAPK